MALPSKKKKGLRLLEHKQTKYYWKVKNNYSINTLHIVVGLESKPSKVFSVEVSFLDKSLYFPWLAAAHEAGRDITLINELDHIGPKFIVSAIDFAESEKWMERKSLKLKYEVGGFKVE